jgi:hypothetical protein
MMSRGSDKVASGVKAYEKLGAFYLGRPYDPESGETLPQPLLYDSKDLLTHAMCVGMTGSGKTGLCISLLEEAALDGIPALIIDVKGDLGNLLLNFPSLKGEEFRPWIDEGEADRQGMDPDAFAASQAALWKNGLAKWNQDGARLKKLQEAAEVAIYTPGSEAGLPVSILSSFEAPPAELLADNDLLQERISTTVSSLLGLLGINADPLKSREHILLSTLLDRVWRQGKSLDLAGLILSLQDPPIERIGVLPLDSFFPAKNRFELAMSINNLLAAPGFQSWLSGTPLDVDRLLYTNTGKPRLAIFSIAHLSDAERMFFVSLLMNQTLGWMRSRSGTSSLRAILYMDEIFGYLPPVANPPSKRPILTLLKQARAFGLGLVLATQNPVDLDYKALSNIGTWFLGRLQTKRDKERVLSGLVGAAGGPSRGELERQLSGMGKRVFLLHNVHEEEAVPFKVRWAMSYLRGPLTRQQIQRLMADKREAEPEKRSAETVSGASGEASPRVEPDVAGGKAARPVLPPEIPEVFLPYRGRVEGLVYQPFLLGESRVHFSDTRKGIETSEEVLLLARFRETISEVDWVEAEVLDVSSDELEREPAEGGRFADPPRVATQKRSYSSWKKSFADTLYRSRRLRLMKSPTFSLVSTPGESERDFRIRLTEVAREERDECVGKLRDKYAKKLQTLEGRIRRAVQKVEVQEEQARGQKFKTALSIGSTLLGAFLGRKAFSSTSVRRAGSAMRGFGRNAKEAQDVVRAEEDLASLEEKRRDLEVELEAEVEELEERFDAQAEVLEPLAIKPRRADIAVKRVALAWVPFREKGEGLERAWL